MWNTEALLDLDPSCFLAFLILVVWWPTGCSAGSHILWAHHGSGHLFVARTHGCYGEMLWRRRLRRLAGTIGQRQGVHLDLSFCDVDATGLNVAVTSCPSGGPDGWMMDDGGVVMSTVPWVCSAVSWWCSPGVKSVPHSMLDLMHRRLGSRPQRILVVSCPTGRTTELLCTGHPSSSVEICASMAYGTFHSVLGGGIRITLVLLALHLLHILVSGSVASVSECCLEVQNWVLRGFRGYSGAMLGSIVDTCSASLPAALRRLPHFLRRGECRWLYSLAGNATFSVTGTHCPSVSS